MIGCKLGDGIYADGPVCLSLLKFYFRIGYWLNSCLGILTAKWANQ